MNKNIPASQPSNTKSCLGCFGVIISLSVIIFIIVAITTSYNSSHPYKGSREDLSNEEAVALDDSYKADLSEVGIDVDYKSIDIKESISKIHKTKGLSKVEKRYLATILGSYMSAYYVDKDQKQISKYVEEMKNEFLSGNLKMNRKDRENVLYNIYIASVLENAIPDKELDQQLKDINNFSLDFGQANRDIYLKLSKKDSHLEYNIEQMKEIVQYVNAPKI